MQSKEQDYLDMIEKAEGNLRYNLIFTQETGEEAVVFLNEGDTVAKVCENYPEWRYNGREVVKDHNYYEWLRAKDDYAFWLDTKDMTEEEYEDYCDAMSYREDCEDIY